MENGFVLCIVSLIPPAQIHFSDVDFEYHFSWIPHPDRTFNWPQARKYCRSLSMDSISMETAAKWKLVKNVFASGYYNLDGYGLTKSSQSTC